MLVCFVDLVLCVEAGQKLCTRVSEAGLKRVSRDDSADVTLELFEDRVAGTALVG